MTHSIALSEVPGKFLDRRKWNRLRKSAPQEITALTYINAIHPDDEADPADFFWDRRGSAPAAVRCYENGRSLLNQCRLLLNRGALIATGLDKRTGEFRTIPASDWINLWPKFATNTASGPNAEYSAITISEANSATFREKLGSDCIAWLKQQRAAGTKLKKASLYHDARLQFGASLTDSIFDAAYLAAFERRRGRPKKKIVSSIG